MAKHPGDFSIIFFSFIFGFGKLSKKPYLMQPLKKLNRIA
jgi:hypothetical protein